MRSTFHGLEVAKRALFTQQTGLQVTTHNIANANTPGYSRQKVTMSATDPIHLPGLTRSTYPGQLGTGVQYDQVVRIRDRYLDVQYRRENSSLGEWTVLDFTLRSIEGILNEPSDNGLRSVIDAFWDSWEALARDPESLSARVNVRGAAINLVETFKHIDLSLDNLKKDLEQSIEDKIKQVNLLAESIAELNKKIRLIEAVGDNANDYRDQRDLLLDQLSKIVDIEVTEDDGRVTIMAGGTVIVDHDTAIQINDISDFTNLTSGELYGYVQSIQEVENTRNWLNEMIHTWMTGNVEVTLPDGTQITVAGFNGLHQLGYGLSGAGNGLDFFIRPDATRDFALDNIELNPAILNDVSLIGASIEQDVNGNGDIARLLASLRNAKFSFTGGNTPLTEGRIDDYYRAVIGDLGVRAYEADRNKTIKTDMVNAIDIRRQSVSGVSLDEEMIELIKFQRAYEAAARSMTVVDEMLDVIINRTGIVGR